MPSLIPAAGTLPWRRRKGRLEVALVHRPKYDDWSWPKGKLDPDELACVAAARETLEETGLGVRLGLPLPASDYPVPDGSGAVAAKHVDYWAAVVTGGTGRLEHEIDALEWVDVQRAHDRLDYSRDRDQLRALVRADRESRLDTWPLALVRHARAKGREDWQRDDQLRPLTATGARQAVTIAGVLAAYGIARLVTSPSVRCRATLEPYAAQAGLRLHVREGLSEEGYAADRAPAGRHLCALLRRGTPAALCSHGPVLPDLLERLAALVPGGHPCADACREELAGAADERMRKGEVLVCHLRGRAETAAVVAVERITT
ncbi:phosphohistidine phosphatase [Intrasporangium chromatireducens Q5-1]|uniref:Phosphohistidine phosphatase n=1 Tax=Intrasporangium chromatireducens Q5-1 TaxID=584657 RepID=W9GIL2_9MICO|nr:NUDIX hydrolase [Intrasporangium chromatireducens]EWT06061.1 phosphohistidine phosphatase [Intrasporangium chromatireducens Q5-1]